MIRVAGFGAMGLLFAALAQAQPAAVRIGVVIDGPWERNAEVERLFQREILDLIGDEFDVSFPEAARIVGDPLLQLVEGELEKIAAGLILIDRIKIEQEENGLDAAPAVVEAAQRRLRPILLTTATTVGGLIPLYLGGGPMWEPMAIAIMFGLVFSTALALGFVPMMYSILFRVRHQGVDS